VGNGVKFIKYKGLKKEKLTIKIPPHGTSQECSQCGHTHPGNRETQAEFICQDCGLRQRGLQCRARYQKAGIKALLDGTIMVEQKKTVRVRKGSRTQIGQGLPESKRASMDLGRVLWWSVCFRQEATVRRTAGIPAGCLCLRIAKPPPQQLPAVRVAGSSLDKL